MSTNEILVWGIVGLTLMVMLLMGPGMWSNRSETYVEMILNWRKERRARAKHKE